MSAAAPIVGIDLGTTFSAVAIVRELHLREVLCPPPLRPRYLDDPQVARKLAKLRQGLTVLQLIERNNECASDS